MFSYSILKKLNQISIIPVRFKHPPNHWSVLRKKIHPIDKALQHFDDFYLKVFEKKWDSIREGLLGKQKYVAVVNNYSDREVIMSELELMGALNMRTLFTLEKQYLKDEFESKNRKSRLEKIWKMEEQIDESLNQVIAETKEFQANQFSLEKSLQDAEIDKERMIDPQNALSAEILQEFVPATKLKGREDFIPESHHYNTFDTSVFDVKVQKEYDIHFPENLNVYCYEINNFSDFKSPKCGSTGVLGYYLMDGGSVLPVLALNLKPGCSMLDVCASPGGKSLLALQTLYPDSVTSNDVSNSRVSRIENVYRQFLYDLDERWLKTGRIKLTNQDGRYLEGERFDRVLVDVPCTTDRHSLKENDNNIFKPSRIKERLRLPEVQSEILFNALKLVNVGGVVVYSTCTLSPIQNDGVIHMTLRRIWEETDLSFVVCDLSPALLHTRRVFQMADQNLLRFGHLVLPIKSQNYGPTYFCKLQREK